MRPMYDTNAPVNLSLVGAPLLPGKAIDTTLRERNVSKGELLVPAAQTVGREPAFGTFLDIDAGKYSTQRGLSTVPRPMIPLLPRQNPQGPTITALNAVLPGWTDQLSFVQSELSLAIGKNPGSNGAS